MKWIFMGKVTKSGGTVRDLRFVFVIEMMWLEFQCREGLKKEKYYLWYLIVHSALLPEIVLLMLGQGVWLGETVDCNQVRGKSILTNQFFRVCLCDEMCSVIFL